MGDRAPAPGRGAPAQRGQGGRGQGRGQQGGRGPQMAVPIGIANRLQRGSEPEEMRLLRQYEGDGLVAIRSSYTLFGVERVFVFRKEDGSDAELAPHLVSAHVAALRAARKAAREAARSGPSNPQEGS